MASTVPASMLLDLGDDVDEMTPEPPPIQSTDKVSWTRPNPANAIEAWLARKWPDFPKVPYVWITGSSVWRHVYGEEVEPDADLDIFVSRNGHPYVSAYNLRGHERHVIWEAELKRADDAVLKWARKHETAPPLEGAKLTTSLGGNRIYTASGSMDIWRANGIFVWHQLANYPATSHAHCRAAYCPATRELIVMPNDAATPDGEFEDLERRSIRMMERANNVNPH